MYRQIDNVAYQQVQLTITSDQKMKEVKQEGEKKVSQMKQQLREEQTRSKQREQEIDQLKRYYSDTDDVGLISAWCTCQSLAAHISLL